MAKEEHREEELTEERALERESRNWAGSHSTDRSGDGCPTRLDAIHACGSAWDCTGAATRSGLTVAKGFRWEWKWGLIHRKA